MTTNKKSLAVKGIYSATVVLLVALILVAANFVASRVLARADLTKDKEFTISKATRDVLRDLDDVVSINVYFSKRLPPNLATLKRNIDDILRGYQAYSRGKVRVAYVDPSSSPEDEQRMRFLGIPQVQLNVLEKDQLQVINGYMGIAILYADRHQAIPVVQDVGTLEYDLTAGILQVLSQKKRVIGYLTGNGAPELDKDFDSLNRLLAQTYEVRPIDLSQGRQPVAEDVNTLIVARPTQVPARVQWQIDQYLMRGGRVIFLVDPMRLDDRMGLANPIPVNSGLEEMLAFYGVKLDRALVQDRQCENAGFSQGYIRYTVPYPLWPKIAGKGLSPENPITSRLDALVLPWCAPLEVLVAEAAGGRGGPAPTPPASSPQANVTATVLARTSATAWLQKGRFDLTPPGPMQQVRPPETGQVYPMAVALTGRFQSFFAGKPVPMTPGDTTAVAAGASAATESPETQVLVVGNSQMANSTFLSMFPGNQEFILNAVDWMTLGDKLIAIRSRGATDRPLKLGTGAGKLVFKYANTFGMAILVAIFGLVRFSVRRRARRAAASTQAAPIVG
jgi:ABC-type uncharacterized transport system involved in gliding motility auxiliary subunit